LLAACWLRSVFFRAQFRKKAALLSIRIVHVCDGFFNRKERIEHKEKLRLPR
jgi:hypothetical protein